MFGGGWRINRVSYSLYGVRKLSPVTLHLEDRIVDPQSYALTVLGVVAVTALGAYLRLRGSKDGPNVETRPKQRSVKRKK